MHIKENEHFLCRSYDYFDVKKKSNIAIMKCHLVNNYEFQQNWHLWNAA